MVENKPTQIIDTSKPCFELLDLDDIFSGEMPKSRVGVTRMRTKMREPQITVKPLQKPDARILELFKPTQLVRFKKTTLSLSSKQ